MVKADAEAALAAANAAVEVTTDSEGTTPTE
jgi:hypothetical protein